MGMPILEAKTAAQEKEAKAETAMTRSSASDNMLAMWGVQIDPSGESEKRPTMLNEAPNQLPDDLTTTTTLDPTGLTMKAAGDLSAFITSFLMYGGAFVGILC